MNFYEELKSKKSLGILILICVIFLILIIKAYSFLPDSNESSKNIYDSRNSQVEKAIQDNEANIEEEEENNEINNETIQKEQDEEIIRKERERQRIEEIKKRRIEEIENEHLKNINTTETELRSSETTTIDQKEIDIDEQYEELFSEASKLYTEKQYVKSLEVYQKAANIVTDKEMQAKCYEQMSIIYATVKKYGTALAFAQKSFNASPTTAREILLARLYYKTGNIDKATTRVNNVLKRDFSADK